MTTITTRAGKGTPLTHTEVDDNFTNLNADKLEASSNLSDVASASSARTNLGLGTAATTASTDYATAAQGALADSSLQFLDNGVLTTLTVILNAAGIADTVELANFTGDGSYIKANRGLTLSADYNNNSGAAQSNITFETDGAEAMRIEGSGNVGIGKTNPSTALDVSGIITATSYAGDGSSLTGIAAGAAGGGSDEIFYENGQNVTTNYTITNGKNAMSAGPITIDSGVTVTVGAGETWTVV